MPGGFAAGTRTTLTMVSNTPGNVLTLGNGVTVRGLEIVDLPGRAGNAIAVVSGAVGDRVSATIAETEIFHPEPSSHGHLGWHLRGGSSVPMPIPLPETSKNALRMHSVDDRIEGFTTGIVALAGARFFPIHGPVSDNSIDLELLGTTISTAVVWRGSVRL